MPAQGGITWTVTSQSETVDQGPDGRLQQGYRVYFTTPSGNSGSIFVPRSAYTAARVQELLRQHVAELEAVSRSTGA